MAENEHLKSYREKRNFTRTREPEGGFETHSGREPIFVIQKHEARNLHYDFRLEVNGVLKSWAVPKGPSMDPKVKRLAAATEDHPLEYADFEGLIAEGEYGAGAVLVWDTGTYTNITERKGQSISVGAAIESGHIAVRLRGEKLKGGYALTRFRTGRRDQWLLVKINDEEAHPDYDPVTTRPESVLTGRTLEDIKAGSQL